MKTCLWIIVTVLLVAIGAPAAMADSVEIGYLTVTSTANSDGTYSGAVSFTNTTTDDPVVLTITQFSANGVGLPLPPTITVPPGQTVPDLIEYTLIVAVIALASAWDLSSADFTVTTPTGIPLTYEGTSVTLDSASWASDSNDTIPIYVNATPVVASPEPSTGLLLSTALLALGMLQYRRRHRAALPG